MNKTLILISILMLLLMLPSVTADPEQYLMPGVVRASSYVQDGTGVWTSRTPVSYTRAYTDMMSSFPVVGDVDDDGRQEIIILADSSLIILNYTSGVGLLTEQSIVQGTTFISTTENRPTPALFDHDSDGDYEIITFNTTHMMMYEWNGTSIELNQSATTALNVSSTIAASFLNPVIKCGQGNQWVSNQDTCVMPISNRSAAAGYATFLAYNLDTNTVSASVAAAASVNGDTHYRDTHLVDGDGDGYLEAYFSRRDGANGDLFIYEVEVGASNVNNTLLYTHNLAANRPFTDIVVNDLYGDGGSLHITWGYSSDAVNYDAFTINAATGTVEDSSYCTIITCPEGDRISSNMVIADDTTYCSFTGDVYYYIRNYAQSDPGVNIDTVLCLSQYAGAGTTETEISNSNSNNTANTPIHQADLHDTTSILLNTYTVSGSTYQSLPLFSNDPIIIPVDATESGSLDLISMNGSKITYWDDAYTNQNYQITGVEWDTGNPVCLDELVTFTLEVTDYEEDSGVCYFVENYANGTTASTSSNDSIAESEFEDDEASAQLNYLGDEVGTFIMTFHCTDIYHTTSDTYIRNVIISNSSGCNYKGSDGGSTTIVPDPPSTCVEDSDCPDGYRCSDGTCIEIKPVDDSATDVLCSVGICGSGGKSMFWLLIMIAVAFLVFSVMKGTDGIVYVIAIVEVMMLVLGWVLGLISSVVLVMVGLICSVILTLTIMRSRPGG